MAKFIVVAGTYAAGDSIPLYNTRFKSCSVFHEDGAAVVSAKGNTNCCPAQYDVSASLILTAGGSGQLRVALIIDGEPAPDAALALYASAAGTDSLSTSTEVAAGSGVAKISLRAVTAVTIAGGNLIVNRRA